MRHSEKFPNSMVAARLHGPSDLRIEQVPHPGPPGPGQVLLRVRCTGVCGSDLHSYLDARIGDTPIGGPLILGHEFSGVIAAVGPEAPGGGFQALEPGMRVAVDPAQPCHHCEPCEQGNPNLCEDLAFCGNYPYGGSFCEWMHMPSRSCFPVPDALDDVEAALLEPLGVAMHAVNLAKLRVASSVAILGAGPIGLLILQLAKLCGAHPIFITDKLEWRLKVAERWGGIPIHCERENAPERVNRETRGRGVDVAVEAAWAGDTALEAVDMTRLGGRVVLVGIPGDDRLQFKHSIARRKGVTVMFSRRMKHIYPRAIALVSRGAVDLKGLVSHRFRLECAKEAFELNTAYRDNVVKVVIESTGR